MTFAERKDSIKTIVEELKSVPKGKQAVHNHKINKIKVEVTNLVGVGGNKSTINSLEMILSELEANYDALETDQALPNPNSENMLIMVIDDIPEAV